jgi:thiosulfate/3-mercaptopyruvate sulfurtransferase
MMLRRKSISLRRLRAVLVLCLFSGILATQCSNEGRDPEKLAVRDNEAVRGGYQIVSTEELQRWLDEIDPRWLSDRESLLIVDTTSYVDSYKKHHIPYAVHFEFPMEEMNELNDKTRAEFEKILGPDRHRKMVFYSESAQCGRSHNGAMWAVSLGYTSVYRYRQGIKEWMEAGNKTETAR